MTVVVARNVSARVRGYLAASMLELAPGVYSAPEVSSAVRERVWHTLVDWLSIEPEASIVMVWKDPRVPGGQDVLVCGLPPIELVEIDGLVVSHRQ